MSGEFRVEERKTGQGERNSAVMSDGASTVHFVRQRRTLTEEQTA
jgi:hypothetical protein